MKSAAAILAIVLLVMAPAHATIVAVTVSGEVVDNMIPDSPLGDVTVGEGVVMSFTVDSNDFVDGAPGDTRGYVIDPSSFSLSFSGGVTVGLLSGGATPYFTVVDGYPVSDGFFVSTSPLSPGGAELEQTPYQAGFAVGYGGDTLASLDILDAQGAYDFDGLTSFGFNVWAFSPDNSAMLMDYSQMTIQAVRSRPHCGSWHRHCLD